MKFERPERQTEKKDLGEFLKNKLEQLAPELKMQAEKLGKLGFDVDENCRIKMNSFLGKLPPKEIANDLTLSKKLKAKHEQSNQKNPELIANKIIGEALEVAKTTGVDSHWFDGRFIAVRSSEYDDYCGNKVDNLIFDSITREPLAAIDATTNEAEKLKNAKEIFNKILNGADVKYGYELQKSEQAPGYKAVPKVNQKLPYFIISFSTEELESIVRDFAEGVESESLKRAADRLLKDLKTQSESFSQHPAIKSEIKAAYSRFLKIFTNLASS